MAVRTKRLGQGRTSTAGAFTTVFTTPADHTIIVKSCVLYVGVTGPVAVTVRFTPATGTERNIGFFGGLVDGQRVVLQEWWVAGPGDSIKIAANVANACSYLLSGTQLFGVASP